MAPPSRTVLLVNGASVTAPETGAGAGPGTIAAAGSGLAGSVLTLGLGGRSYEIPAAALPYLGRGLDLSLFDLPLLSARENGGRLPVRVAYQGRRPRLPGVTIVSAAGGFAAGYLTAASARAFGAALIRQYLADHARGSYGQDGLFANRVTVSLAGVAVARAARPLRAARPPRAARRYALHTLTVTGTDLAGRGDTGDSVLVFNADNTRRFGDLSENQNFFYRGTAKFSVPGGHYWALADFIDVSPKGKPTAERLDVLPQFTVTRATTVHMAERAADSKITMVTPRPSVVSVTGFELRRLPRTGLTMSGYWLENGSFPLWVSPAASRVTAGRLQSYTEQWRNSPAGAAGPYSYDLAYAATGIIRRQRFVVRPGSLATIHARYYGIRSRGYVQRYGLFRPQFIDATQVFLPEQANAMPARRTWYVTGNPAITWWGGMDQYAEMSYGTPADSGGEFGGPRIYRAREKVREDWDTYPLHPGVGTPGGRTFNAVPGEVVPSASRAGDVLRLDVSPFSDRSGHLGSGFFDARSTVTGSYQIDENGKRIAVGRTVVASGKSVPQWAIFNFWQVKVGSKPSVIRFTVTAARTRAKYPLSTRTRTTWTWRSAPEPSGRLPAGWECSPNLGTLLADRNCAVEPMMTLSYSVTGLALNESAPPGRQELRVTAAHLALARAARVTAAAVQVSFDGGRTWQHAAISGRAGHYTAAYTAPAGSSVTLRVSASDTAGGHITETITRAYRVASS